MPDAMPPAALREATVNFWLSKGAPQHVAEGIADRVGAESGFNPLAWNPNDKGSPSGGLYQHHGDRLQNLLSRQDPGNPLTQHELAYGEVTGGDPVATRHWKDILAAPTRAAAATMWDRYFERSAGSGAASGQPMNLLSGPSGPMPDFGGLASRLLTSPVNALSAPAVAASPATPPTSTAGNLTPGSDFASTVALMALANAGTHKIEPVDYDPFKRQPEAVPVDAAVAKAPGIASAVPATALPRTTSPVQYVTRLGMRASYQLPGMEPGQGTGATGL